MQIFYHPFNSFDTIITFSEEERRHLFVLRHTEKDLVDVMNGKGLLAKVKIMSIDKKNAVGQIQTIQEMEKPTPSLHLVISPLKNSERIEWLLEKACEMGLSKFTLLQCDRTERSNFKLERLEKIVISASKQAKQFWFPQIFIENNFKDFLSIESSDQKVIAFCEEIERPIQHVLVKDKSSIILIGPEGDFTPKEVEVAKSFNYSTVSLGASRLRSETAGLYAVAVHRVLNSL